MTERIIRPHHYQLPLVPFSQGKQDKLKTHVIDYFLIIFIFLIFILGVYYIYQNEPGYNLIDSVMYSGYNLRYISDFITKYDLVEALNQTLSQTSDSVQDDTADIPQIESDELHWQYMPISFSFSNPEDCGGFQTRRILRAFDEISNATSGKITFMQLNNSGSINIICNKNFLPPPEPGLLQSGEATVKSVGNIVLSADINFYNTGGDSYNGGCRNYPDVEIHEILHAFGFQHTDEPNNIMNAVGEYCPTHINDDIVQKLMSIYG